MNKIKVMQQIADELAVFPITTYNSVLGDMDGRTDYTKIPVPQIKRESPKEMSKKDKRTLTFALHKLKNNNPLNKAERKILEKYHK